MLSCDCFSKQKNVSMFVPSHCKRHQIASRVFHTSFFFGRVMRIFHFLAGHCSHTVKKSAAKSNFGNMKDTS